MGHQFLEMRAQRALGQRQLGGDLGAVEPDVGAGTPHDADHGRVVTGDMDQQVPRAAVAGVRHGVVEQLCPEAPPARTLEHRDAELGRGHGLVGRWLECEVGHGHQLQAAVEHAEDEVALELDVVDVVLDLFVGGDLAETQQPVGLAQGLQMGQDAAAVAWTEVADGHPAPCRTRAGVVGKRGFEHFGLLCHLDIPMGILGILRDRTRVYPQNTPQWAWLFTAMTLGRGRTFVVYCEAFPLTAGIVFALFADA